MTLFFDIADFADFFFFVKVESQFADAVFFLSMCNGIIFGLVTFRWAALARPGLVPG